MATKKTILLLACCTMMPVAPVLLCSPANAGFDWKPPAESQQLATTSNQIPQWQQGQQHSGNPVLPGSMPPPVAGNMNNGVISSMGNSGTGGNVGGVITNTPQALGMPTPPYAVALYMQYPNTQYLPSPAMQQQYPQYSTPQYSPVPPVPPMPAPAYGYGQLPQQNAMQPQAGNNNNNTPAINYDPLGRMGNAQGNGTAVEQAMLEISGSLHRIPAEEIELSSGISPYYDQMAETDKGFGVQDIKHSLAPSVETSYPAPPMPYNSLGPAVRQQRSYKYIEGFARNLPLAMAVSQVVPDDFSFSFGEDVDVGVEVSWHGGKPWNEVLYEMLSPHGLEAVINGNQVLIR